MVAVGELADRYVEEMAALDPCAAAEMGVAGHDAELTDYGPDGVASRAALLRGTLSQLGPAPEATAAEPFEVTVMRERLGAELALYDAGLRLGEVNVLDGSLEQLRLVFDLMDTGSEAAWENLAARLRRLPAALDRHREGILRAAADGQMAASRQVEGSAEQCALWTGSFSELPAAYGDGPLRQELERGAARVNQALEGFVRFLREELAPIAPGHHLQLGHMVYRADRLNRYQRLACRVAGQSFLDFEIDRYLGRPGQAISYKVGERVWLDVREAARRRRADGFDLRAFHAMALDMGPMGLDTLRERLVDGAGG